MKNFNEMSQKEINNLTDDEWMAIPPEEKRSCYDCGHLYSALSLWCGSDDAIAARGTRIPGIIKCKWWIMSGTK